MRFFGEPVTVAVASQLMVGPEKRRPFAPMELLRKYFSGNQDLSFSDGANPVAQNIWEAAGGSTAMRYSSVWTRVLRPTEYIRVQCERRGVMHPIPRLLQPFT
jgi:hypothetical protein